MLSDFRDVFTPNAPVSEATLLVGRGPQLKSLRNALSSRGAHPAIVGSRGVGKTSLVHHACKTIPHTRINCSTDSTFDSLAKAVLESAGFAVLITPGMAKAWALDDSTTARAIRLRDDRLSLQTFYSILCSIGSPLSIVLDEYDRLPRRNDPKAILGDLVKMLSDHVDEHQCTLVFVGVGASIRDLFGAHQSIHRQVEEVYLSPLRDSDIHDFLKEAESMTKLVFDDQVREELVQASRGLPYVTHLLGKEAVLAATDRSDFCRTIMPNDFEIGKERVAKRVFNSHLEPYRAAMSSLSPSEKSVLRCLANVSHLSQNACAYAATLNGEHQLLPPDDFYPAVQSLCQKKVLYLGPKGTTDVRFADPLLGVCLRLRLGVLRLSKKKKGSTVKDTKPPALQMDLPLVAGLPAPAPTDPGLLFEEARAIGEPHQAPSHGPASNAPALSGGTGGKCKLPGEASAAPIFHVGHMVVLQEGDTMGHTFNMQNAQVGAITTDHSCIETNTQNVIAEALMKLRDAAHQLEAEDRDRAEEAIATIQLKAPSQQPETGTVEHARAFLEDKLKHFKEIDVVALLSLIMNATSAASGAGL